MTKTATLRVKLLILNRFFVFLLILSSVSAFAQEKSLLWEVSGNGLAKPSYVYGTIHMICPKDYLMTDSTKSVFGRAEQVYLELDMDDPTIMTKMMQTSMLTNGKKLKDYLSEDDYAVLDNYFKERLKMSLAMYNGLKPFTVMSMIYMTFLDCQPQSYELMFTQMATNAKKELLGLETVEFQMGVFDQIPYEKQAALLVDMVRKKEESSKEFEKMVALYKAQDLEALVKLMDDSNWDFNGYEDILLANRNANWIPIMEKAMQAKSSFFAVGAGHLGGEKGVLSLLKKKGYSVKPIL
ncbi:TraB/GumN family protein [Runella sp. SP2]|uniref:TraB/GumN family protein n=1 Tax=Runella sp. SP2 TaxID=2268026 RepID=UPI000F0730F5|nr:TraB/GumN family protein [Runella sp. SP2]AYQ32132.1 TraB/GumN family protein [Runella sp. SP2]